MPDRENLPEVAIEAMRGENDAVWLPLASYDKHSLEGVDQTFEAILRQLSGRLLNMSECVHLGAKELSKLIVSGKVTAREGARLISSDIYHKVTPPEQYLGPFVYWADEYDEAQDQDRRSLCEKGPIDAANCVLQLNGIPHDTGS